MGLDFLKRIGRATAVFGALTFAFVAVYYDVRFASGILIGCLWGVANFAVLAALLAGIVTPFDVNRRKAIILAAIKFPVLYGAGHFILRSERFAPESLLTGFSLLFLVTLLKTLGRNYLRLDNRAASIQHT